MVSRHIGRTLIRPRSDVPCSSDDSCPSRPITTNETQMTSCQKSLTSAAAISASLASSKHFSNAACASACALPALRGATLARHFRPGHVSPIDSADSVARRRAPMGALADVFLAPQAKGLAAHTQDSLRHRRNIVPCIAVVRGCDGCQVNWGQSSNRSHRKPH